MNSTARGDDLENRVCSFFEAEIRANRFLAKPECCAIMQKKGYYSRDRQTDIVFDVAIELTLPGADAPSSVWLLECKHYSHPVPVSDIEEFFAKVQQVGAAKSKAVVVTSNSFQSGAIEFARSKGIGLLRMFPKSEFKWDLLRSPSSLRMSRSLSRDGDIWNGLTQENYQSRRFDFFCNVRDLFTYSLHDFFTALTSDVLDIGALNAIAPQRNDIEVVAFMTLAEIENRCRVVLRAIGYQGGAVSLESVCEWQKLEVGLTVVSGAVSSRHQGERATLGCISFRPPSIIVFSDPMGSRRQRFTLAHELGHLLLGHSQYLRSERVDAKDIENGDYTDLGVDDIKRLEWQANRFASCLLLPLDSFVPSVVGKAQQLGLKDRGYGLIYLDQQPENIRNYDLLTSALTDTYEVSRTAVTIRLKDLGLLNDSSAQSPSPPALTSALNIVRSS